MNKRLELTGQRFGDLEVLWFSHIGKGGSYWVCKCVCGTTKPVPANALTRGKTKSCGCGKAKRLADATRIHNMSKHKGYSSWKAMQHRCTSPTHASYPEYGGRGITICDGWQTFEGFWREMGPTWRRGLSLDRVDPNKGYGPDNCRWATPLQQGRNRRNNRIIETPAGPMNLSAAVERYGVGQKTIVARIALGLTDPKDLVAPAGTFRRKRLPKKTNN